MYLSPLDWELEEMFGAGNNAVWAIEDLIQVAGTHRALIILDKVYKAFLSIVKTSLTGPTNYILPIYFWLAPGNSNSKRTLPT